MLPVAPSRDYGGVRINLVYCGASQFYGQANIENGDRAQGPLKDHKGP